MCHPVHRFVAVGTVNGYIYYIDIKNLKQPKIIHQVYVMRAGNFCIIAKANG